jgi:hypothetical protein
MIMAHFWMGTGATLGAAAMMGLGLGSYVTSPQRPAADASAYVDGPTDDQIAAQAALHDAQKGPAVIHCTGCGPTLADRRWRVDMAGLDLDGMIDGSRDPVVQDYEAARAPEDLLPAAPPAPVHPLPPQVARFAAGDTAPPPVIVTRTEPNTVPPPTLVATTAEGVRP